VLLIRIAEPALRTRRLARLPRQIAFVTAAIRY
jgi:hypothetical protein